VLESSLKRDGATFLVWEELEIEMGSSILKVLARSYVLI